MAICTTTLFKTVKYLQCVQIDELIKHVLYIARRCLIARLARPCCALVLLGLVVEMGYTTVKGLFG
jgi:hypothetical protein